ncbi:MAG: hypothetical protein JSV76_04060 [Candidatus Bathyarchaeota archaeon]|nr:MAG: hypothetical protein JSV76_04060 [Candidatus Bathyarchaeota archaeon]
MKKKISVFLIVLTILALSQLPLIVMALEYDENVSLTITSSGPVLGAVSLTDNSDVATTSVDPEATYKVKFSVSDSNTLDDLTDIVVDIYYETQSAVDIRRSYTFTWTEGAGSTPFTSSPAGYVVSSVTPTAAEELASSFNFELHFSLDGVAVPSGAATTWHIDVTVTDDSSNTDSDTTTVFDVTLFHSITASTSTIAFGSAIPGGSLTKQSVTVTFTANSEVNIDVQGADLVSGSDTISADQFNAWDDSAGTPSAHTLSTSDTTIYAAYKAVTDAINAGITGYTDAGDRLLGFDGTVPDPQASGTYTAVWKIKIDQSIVTPS